MAFARLFPRKLPDGRTALICEGELAPGDEYPDFEEQPWRNLLLTRGREGWCFEFRSEGEEIVRLANSVARGDFGMEDAQRSHPRFVEYLDRRADVFCEERGIDPPPSMAILRLEIGEAIAHGEVNPCGDDVWGVGTNGDLPKSAIAALGHLPHWAQPGDLPTGGYGLILQNGRRPSELIRSLDPFAPLTSDDGIDDDGASRGTVH